MTRTKEFETEYISREEFVQLALEILGDNKKYEDDILKIEKEPFASSLDLEITRKKMHETNHLRVENPVTMVKEGRIIRHHGEHMYAPKGLRMDIERLNLMKSSNSSFLNLRKVTNVHLIQMNLDNQK